MAAAPPEAGRVTGRALSGRLAVSGGGLSRRGLALGGGGLLVLLALVLRVIALVQVGLAEGDDFTPYWNGAAAVAAGQSPYAWLAEHRPQEVTDYIYPPLLAVLLAPATRVLDYAVARWAWLGIGVGCVLIGFWLIWRTTGLTVHGPSRLAAWALVVLLPLLLGPLGTGQLTPLLFLLITGAHALLVARRPVVAGGALAGAVGGGLGLVGLTLLGVGWEPHWAYFAGVVPAQRRWFGMPLDVSINGFWTRLLMDNGFTTPVVSANALGVAAIAATTLVVLGLTGWAVWRLPAGRAPESLGFALVVAAMMLVAPINGQYNLLLAVLPLAVLAAHVQAAWPRDLRWLLVIVLLLSLPVEPCDLVVFRDACLARGGLYEALVWRQGWGTLLVSGPFFGLLLLWGVLLRLCAEASGAVASTWETALTGLRRSPVCGRR
ncbi:MAG TPA: glycosyltransferase 87 family protein [Chloroflexota bacterium]|nr:glycosyltransferase 87 family protein [Chloroflexota bacterium]